MQTSANTQRDLDALTVLNRDFFASVQKVALSAHYNRDEENGKEKKT